MKLAKPRFLVIFLSFLATFVLGYGIAINKPLWNDEIFTLTHSVLPISSIEIWMGLAPEGNLSPLYYLLQKWTLALFSYVPPLELNPYLPIFPRIYAWHISHPESQIVLRLFSILCAASTVAVLVRNFFTSFGFAGALISFVMTCSSYSLLAFMAEARPYALWIFLSTLQTVLLARQCQQTERTEKYFLPLLGVHFLLAFTISFSLAQILAAAGVLFVFSNLKKSKIFVLSLPAVVTLYYQIFGLQGQVIRYHFMGNPFDLLLSAIPLDRILMAALILVFLIKNSSMRFIDSLKSELGQSLLWGMVSVAMGGILIFLFYVKMNHTEKVGFAIPNRYFVFIFPPVLYALTQGFCQVWQQWQTHPEKWLNRTLVFLLSVLTFLRVLRGFQQYYQGKLF